MIESDETLVLRSVNLPMSMDEGLRGMAYRLRCSKSELIRHFVGQGLATLQQRVGEGRIGETLQQRILAELSGAAAPADAPSRARRSVAARAVVPARARALSSDA